MALKASNWIHGTAAMVQTASWNITRVGQWSSVVPGKDLRSPWIHLAIPTPSVPTTKIRSAMVRLGTGPKTSLVDIDVWNGEQPLWKFANKKTFPLGGDWIRFEFPTPLEVQWGVGISMNFKVDAPDHPDSEIRVIGAGAEFVTEPK